MLEHDLKAGEIADHTAQHALDEHCLAVEHIDVRVGYLAVDAQHHPDFLHPLEHGGDVADVGDSACAVGGRAGGIKLCRDPRAFLKAALNLVGSGGVGE